MEDSTPLYSYSDFHAPLINTYNGHKIYGWFSECDIKWYRDMVSKLNNCTIVEIGVWQGASVLSIADICAKNNIKQIGIEPFFHNENELNKLIQELGYSHIELISDYSYNIKDNFENDSLDFVFIDGDHSYDSVLKDMEDWYDKVKKGGVIAGHDYLPNGGWPENFVNNEEAVVPEGFQFNMFGPSQAVKYFTDNRKLEFKTVQNIWYINK